MLNFRRIGSKVREVLSRKENARSVEKWSFHRFTVFFFSLKGQRQIWMYGFRTAVFIFEQLTGIEQKKLSLYELWMRRNMPKEKDLKRMSKEVKDWTFKPLISVVLPVYNAEPEHLEQAVNSVLEQVYPYWELCIADDASTHEKTAEFLNSIKKDNRIKITYRQENGHIAKCTNTAIDSSTGDYIAFLDQDDMLAPEALFEVVSYLKNNKQVQLLYSDEDKIDHDGKFVHPHFKPEWCKDNLYSRNYIGHLVVVQREFLLKSGKLHEGVDGAQDYDLLLRLTEQTPNIGHIPKVLYHWRMHQKSSASGKEYKLYAFEAQKKVLDRTYNRLGLDVVNETEERFPGVFHPRYNLRKYPKVSIIIPSHNKADILEVCLSSIFKKTDYANYEVLVISNNSTEDSFFELIDKYRTQEPDRMRFEEINVPFNFSFLMNRAVERVDSPLIVLLNNDTEIITGDWLTRMAEHALRPEIGAVGVKLLYPNDTIQHAGVIIGLGGPAGHNFIGVSDDNGGYYYQIAASSNYSAVTAACTMVERNKYMEINGFDEEQVIEFNDVDFCLRLRESGYRNLYLPTVKLYHHESLTRGHPHLNKKSYAQHLKDVDRFNKRWKEYIENDPCYSPNLSRVITTYEPRI